jgi:hypothetical protein
VSRQPVDAVLWADAHEEDAVVDEEVMEPGLWKKNGWIARVIKNPDDDGWAVEMTRIGDDEPALVGPWTMGRDKKNPKPLDQPAFLTLVKTASEVLRRHEQSARAGSTARSRSSTTSRRQREQAHPRRPRPRARRRGSACDPGALRRRDERTAEADAWRRASDSTPRT